MEIIVEGHSIPDCSSCESRKGRTIISMMNVTRYDPDLSNLSRKDPENGCWICPEIGLITCDEAPACTHYTFNKEGE